MKLQQIIEVLAARLAAIDGSGDYHTKIGNGVVRGKRKFTSDELPACCLYLGPRVKDSATGERAKLAATVVIEAYHAIGDAHPGDVGIELLSDIQRACELVADPTLDGLLMDRLDFQGDEIFYPDDAGDTVGVEVTYAIPHMRRYGDPQ